MIVSSLIKSDLHILVSLPFCLTSFPGQVRSEIALQMVSLFTSAKIRSRFY